MTMGYLEAIKSFFLKKSFDFDREDIYLYNFHPQLRILLSLKGIFFNEKKSKLRFILPAYFSMLTVVGLVMEGMFVHRGLTTKDYSFATECFCYFIIISTTPFVYHCLFNNREKTIQLFEDMNEEFKLVCSLGPKHRHAVLFVLFIFIQIFIKLSTFYLLILGSVRAPRVSVTPFLTGQLLIWKLRTFCYAWFTLAVITGTMFMMFPVLVLFYQTLFVTHTESTIRPLAFSMWLPNDDPYRTPNYELFIFIEMNFSVILVQTFGVYIYTLFHILLHYYFILDMMIIDFEVIFDGLDQSVVALPADHPWRRHVQMILNTRIKRIVTWHKSVIKILDTLAIVYGPILVFQILGSSFVVCIIGYQIAESLNNGSINFLFIMLGVCACMQLWIPCYLGTLLRNKIMSAAYSYFNMLRNIN